MKIEQFVYRPDTGWLPHFTFPFGSEQTLVLVFGGSEYLDTPKPLVQLTKAFPNAHILGCSTSGEILGTVLLDHSLVVVVIHFEHTRLLSAMAKIEKPSESYNAGRKLAAALNAPDLRGVLVLSDGSIVNGTELVQGFNLSASVTVTGGLAGDGSRFQRTWVIATGKAQPQTGLVAAVGFYGPHIAIGYGSQSGWQPMGMGNEWVVTRADGNVLYELNGQPALAVYRKMVGGEASDLPLRALSFPLALRANAADNKPIIRAVRWVDEEKQSITLGGDVPQDFLAQLMCADLDGLIGSAAQAAAMSRRPQDQSAEVLCVAISCVGRRMVLRRRAQEELQATLGALPANTQQIGFYSYGEISPSGGYCDLHNQTMTLTTFCEI